jgi:hypothetical protein
LKVTAIENLLVQVVLALKVSVVLVKKQKMETLLVQVVLALKVSVVLVKKTITKMEKKKKEAALTVEKRDTEKMIVIF